MSKWYKMTGAESDTAICTKVTLARNVSTYPFTPKLPLDKREEITANVLKILDEKLPAKFGYSKMSDFSGDEAISLAERNLVSPEFVSSAGGRNFICTEDESLSIMLFEEDHIKMQGLLPGLELAKSFELCNTLDDILDKELHFSYNDELGFLTACPTNIGTAMRASVTLHLPALHKTGQISKLSVTVSKLGLVLTGAYGEGLNPQGDLFVLSNLVTLGITEKSAIENLNSIALSIIEQERGTRKKAFKDIVYQDAFYRSLGSLKNARILTYDELTEDLSNIRMGMGSTDEKIPFDRLNELVFTMQPATINVSKGKTLNKRERDEARAKYVRELFSK